VKRSFAFPVLVVLAVLPGAWWLATTPPGASPESWVAASAALVTTLGVVGLAVRGHRRGTFLPNRCPQCGGAMGHLPRRALKPPAGREAPSGAWRCLRCGYLRWDDPS